MRLTCITVFLFHSLITLLTIGIEITLLAIGIELEQINPKMSVMVRCYEGAGYEYDYTKEVFETETDSVIVANSILTKERQ